MEFSDEHIGQIRESFLNAKDLDGLLRTFNFIIEIENLNSATSKRKTISKRALNFFLYHKKDRYYKFSIPKKTGGQREIKAPDKFWKKVQRKLNICLNCVFEPKLAANGFITGRSIVTNAKVHVNKKFVLNLDIKDFFPNTKFGRVKAVMKIEPFNFPDEVAGIIANICCAEGCLPQGAPTSPTMTNIVCQRLDRKLVQLGKKNKFHYTRYADDLTFSSSANVFDERLIREIKNIIRSEGYEPNDAKERLQLHTERQTVTGIIVNRKTNVPRRYLKNVRAMLHCWETKGLEAATIIFQEEYKKEKGFLRYNGVIPAFENVLHGKILYLGMVRGAQDGIFTKYKRKYEVLQEREKIKSMTLELETLSEDDKKILLELLKERKYGKAIQ